MSTVFEIGESYEHTWPDGERSIFTVSERLKNGNWRGVLSRQYAGRKPRKPILTVIFNPPALPWRKVTR